MTARVTPLSLGAVAGVTAMALLATGDVLLAGVVLAVAAGEAVAGVAAVLAGVAVLVRWGTTSLGGIGGDQAVLGWAGAVGPALAAASTWCAAAALVLVPRTRWPVAVGAGALAALVVAGPTDTAGWAVRVVATIVAVGASWLAARSLPRGALVVASSAAATVAVVLAVLA